VPRKTSTCGCGAPMGSEASRCRTCTYADRAAAGLLARKPRRRCACGNVLGRTTEGTRCMACIKAATKKQVPKPKPKPKRTQTCPRCGKAKARCAVVCKACDGSTRRKKPRAMVPTVAAPGTRKRCSRGRDGCGQLKDVREYNFSRVGKNLLDPLCRTCIALREERTRARRAIPAELLGMHPIPIDDEEREQILDWRAACDYALDNGLPLPPNPIDVMLNKMAEEAEDLLDNSGTD
jgi:hypothetical protein